MTISSGRFSCTRRTAALAVIMLVTTVLAAVVLAASWLAWHAPRSSDSQAQTQTQGRTQAETRTSTPGSAPASTPSSTPSSMPALTQSPSPSEPEAQTHAIAHPPGSPVSQPARGDVTLDLRRQQLIGVRTVTVARQALSQRVRATGLVRYDETRLTDVNLKVEAWIRSLAVNYTGQFVRKGQTLFTVYSPQLLATQQEYALALASRAQLRASAMPDTQQYAERLVAAARQRLALWDLSPDQIQALERGEPTEPTAIFRSPATGIVIEKRAIEGLHVSPGESLYRIADLSVVWVEADVYEQESSLLRVGAQATVTLDAYPGERFPGRVSYVHPMVDEKTRTVRARLTLANRTGRLKPGMYASVELSSAPRTALAVPANAVLDSGTEQLVFLSHGSGHFEPRRVTLGQRFGDIVEIQAGLKAGDEVATSAAFFLDSESQMRASLQGFAPASASEAASASASASAAAPAPEAAPAPAAAPAPVPEAVRVALRRPSPDAITAGENLLEVEVKTASGQPVTDAEVTVAFYMAPMPTMNMPAMRNEAKLAHVGNGMYRGPATVMMAGRWEVQVTATRNGRRIATQPLTVTAR